ncbi:DEAD H (Asp-Glu-Ala-Asp His) box helicase 11 [Bonamia ostreae]|uniref:DEAD H (Asp-Glu-Ala-Asp His) box helicase 11 n=1 Tax=Bonamia ostreae TaxID=126728 RepID=A0ABV2AFL5_9EUKA
MSIENSVVVIDEAHNLIEALFQMYSQTVAQNDFSKFAENLNLYKNKYKNRFSRQNLQKLEKMENFLTNLGHFLENFEDFTKIFSVVEFERLSKIEDFNLNPLIQYFEENNISKKMVLNKFLELV